MEHSIKLEEYTFLSVTHGTFHKTEHTAGHKASLSEYKKTEVTPHVLSTLPQNKAGHQEQEKCRKYKTHGE